MKLTYTWDKELAEYRYVLTQDNGDKFTGDLNWAQRTARHYKLELPKVPEA